MTDSVLGDIEKLDEERKTLNARRITLVTAIAALGLVVLTVVSGFPPVVLAIAVVCTVVVWSAYFIARRGHSSAAVTVMIAADLLGCTGAVVGTGLLGSSPFYLVLAMLMALATLSPRGVIVTSVSALLSLVVMTIFAVGVPQASLGTFEIMPNAVIVVLITVVVVVMQAKSWVRLVSKASAMEIEQHKAETRYRLIANNSKDFIVLVGLDGEVEYMSPSIPRELKVEQDALTGMPFSDFLKVGLGQEFDEIWSQVVGGTPARFTAELSQEPGRFVEVLMNRTPDDVVLVSARDVTEQRELGRRLQNAQKMEALGRLAGGVAHDFNNLLGVILGASELASISVASGESVQDDLECISAAAERGAKLTQQLLTFAKRQVLETSEVSVNATIREIDVLLRPLVGGGVQLSLELPERALMVRCAAIQLEQLVMNLAINARDAMPHGGALSIRLSYAALDNSTLRGDYAKIEVVDSGAGIPEEDLPRIFEPFFTTKAVGVGTGLGLPTCMGIAEQLGGTIEVETRLEQGTSFTIFLPLSESSSEVESLTVAGDLNPSPCVLIVDDEPDLRSILERYASVRASKVLTAGSASEAITLIERVQEDVDVAVCDVMLDDGVPSGLTVIDAVDKAVPGVALVLVSSYVDSIEKLPSSIRKRAVFLQKPFTGEQLWVAIDKAQQQRSRRAQAS